MLKKLFHFLLLFMFLKTYSQEVLKDSLFYITVKNKTNLYSFQKNLKKASQYFHQQNWDSTIVFADRFLYTNNKNRIKRDYAHFFRAHGFQKKNIIDEAEKSYSFISDKFDFNDIVRLKLGEINLKKRKYNKAINSFKKLLVDQNGNKEIIKIKNIIQNLGVCYLHLKKFDKAEAYFNQSLNQSNDTLELIGDYTNIANLYYDQYKDDEAITFFMKAYNIAKKVNLRKTDSMTSKMIEENRRILDEKRRVSLNMAVVEQNRKDYKKALKYRKEMEHWNELLYNENKIYAVVQKEKEFAVQQKQNEVDILQVQNELKETQRNVLFYSALGLFVLLGVSLYFYREKVKRNKIIANQKENLDALNATKDKLFSIVSHDLRSSVNALKTSNGSLVKNLDSNNLSALRNLLQKNSAIVNGAYGLLDNLLNWALLQTNQGYFSISSLRLFFITEQVSYNYQPLLLEKELSLENTVSKKDIVFADQESLKIVLRNLLDNAIKFSKPNGSIKIYSQNSSDDFCDLIIEDTGLGMSETTRLELLKDTALLHKKEHEDVIGTGLGLQLCKSMIRKNNGKFDIESELGKGTKMIVSLPKNPSNE